MPNNYKASYEHEACSVCDKPIHKGELITWSRKPRQVKHVACLHMEIRADGFIFYPMACTYGKGAK